MTERSIGVRYSEAVRSFIDLARTLSDDEWSTPVPCTPLWTVRDVLSHVSGIPDDAFAGRMDGAVTEPWTASQVERNAAFSVEDLLTRWEGQYEMFGEVIDGMGEQRPPFDCHSHEHDVRQAIGRPGDRDSAVIVDAAPMLLDKFAGAPLLLTVTFEDGAVVTTGQAEVAVRLVASRFEVFRSMLGRRTAGQVRRLDWSGDADGIDAVMAQWFTFGPSEVEIVE